MHPDHTTNETFLPGYTTLVPVDHQTSLRKDIEHRFTHHAPKGDQVERYQQIRDEFKKLALLLTELTPQSREQSLAFTHLEQASMFANASIARNE